MRSVRLMPVWMAVLAVIVSPPLMAEETPLPAPVTAELGADEIQRATILLDSYSYAPRHLIVQAGKPVELTLTSVTTLIPHNFVLKNPAAGLDIEKDVSPGKTEKVTFTPTQPGLYTFYCDRRLWPMPSHREKGMEGTLDVRP